MLIICPECELQVSDMADHCPHCGYPIGTKSKSTIKRSTNKRRMRLPNGFGQITEIKNRRLRKPWRAMTYVGKDKEGKTKTKLLGYYASYNEAYSALLEYNKNPYDLDKRMTLQELYEEWSKVYITKLKKPGSFRSISSAWDKCTAIYGMRASDIRSRHIKGVMDQPNISQDTKSRIKSMFNLMLDYAVEFEICEKNYARDFTVEGPKEEDIKHHIPFTEEEMEKFWANTENDIVKMILIQCYGGWRPQELCKIEVPNVNIASGFITGGMKTDAGTDRIVPIHPKILPFVEYFYDDAISNGRKYLCGTTDTYDKFRHRFKTTLKSLNINPEHRCHDGRKHFVTIAKKAEIDEYAIKYIIGHAISDITERVYTERDPSWLMEEMKKIK